MRRFVTQARWTGNTAALERNRTRENGDRTRATLDFHIEELRTTVLWFRDSAEDIVQQFSNRFPELDVEFDDDNEGGGMEADAGGMEAESPDITEAEEYEYFSNLQEQCELMEEEMESPQEEEVEVEDAAEGEEGELEVKEEEVSEVEDESGPHESGYGL